MRKKKCFQLNYDTLLVLSQKCKNQKNLKGDLMKYIESNTTCKVRQLLSQTWKVNRHEWNEYPIPSTLWNFPIHHLILMFTILLNIK